MVLDAARPSGAENGGKYLVGKPVLLTSEVVLDGWMSVTPNGISVIHVQTAPWRRSPILPGQELALVQRKRVLATVVAREPVGRGVFALEWRGVPEEARAALSAIKIGFQPAPLKLIREWLVPVGGGAQ